MGIACCCGFDQVFAVWELLLLFQRFPSYVLCYWLCLIHIGLQRQAELRSSKNADPSFLATDSSVVLSRESKVANDR